MSNKSIPLATFNDKHPGDATLPPTYTKLVSRDGLPVEVAEDIQRRSEIGFTEEDKAAARKQLESIFERNGTSLLIFALNGDGYPDDQGIVEASMSIMGPGGYYKPCFREACLTYIMQKHFEDFRESYEEKMNRGQKMGLGDQAGMSAALIQHGMDIVHKAVLCAFPEVAAQVGNLKPRG